MGRFMMSAGGALLVFSAIHAQMYFDQYRERSLIAGVGLIVGVLFVVFGIREKDCA